MMTLILALTLNVLNCGPQDQKKFPQYCACVNNARNQHQDCLEREYQACEPNGSNSKNFHVSSCHDRAETKCSKQRQNNYRMCEDTFPRRK